MTETVSEPLEQDYPRHRGEAYSDFEKKIDRTFTDAESLSLSLNPKLKKCCSIIFYPKGAPNHNAE